MVKQEQLEKMQARQQYRNLWHTDLMGTMSADLPYFCFTFWCSPCASYLLRKRALYDDMSRYVCCAGYMPCSGSCGESRCPEFCLCTETQHKVELDKRDGQFGPTQAPPQQHMSRMDQAVPPLVGYTPGYAGPPPGYAYGQPVYGQSYPPPSNQPQFDQPPGNYYAGSYPQSHYPK